MGQTENNGAMVDLYPAISTIIISKSIILSEGSQKQKLDTVWLLSIQCSKKRQNSKGQKSDQ